MFLVFTDGTRFELYGEAFTCCSGVDEAEGIGRYVRSSGGEIVGVYDEPPAGWQEANMPLTTGPERAPYHVRAPESLTEAMSRDLQAWQAAKAAIAKAKAP